MGWQTFIWGGQEDGIAMKGAQSKVKWGGQWGAWCEWGIMSPPPPALHCYATACLYFSVSLHRYVIEHRETLFTCPHTFKASDTPARGNIHKRLSSQMLEIYFILFIYFFFFFFFFCWKLTCLCQINVQARLV